MVVDVKSGRQLAAVRATDERRAPGSILKPLFLAAALEQHEVLPETTVFCRRNLHISYEGQEWNLACTHPQSDVAFAAKEALAYSCNRYFAELADRIPPAQTSAILEHYGLGQTHTPQSQEQKELLVLGVAGISVSPVQMAVAYRKLALELDQAKAPAVRDGLRDSVSYGMAHNAAVRGDGDRRQDRDRRRGAARPEPRMVRRHRLPGQRGSGDGGLPAGRQWSGCRPAGA